MYIGQHFRDGFITMDSARGDNNGNYTFSGRRKWDTGIYALYGKEGKKSLLDFTIDGSQKFTIRLSPSNEVADPQKDIVGSPANQIMFSFLKREDQAKKQAREIDKKKKSGDAKVKDEAEKEMELLSKDMINFEDSIFKANSKYRFFQLAKMFNGPEVPDEVEDKALYYRTHFWDGIDLTDHSLIYTPDLFNKMNYYFFGVLYHMESDTVCRYADMLFKKIENDSVMMRYFMDFIMPKYYRSTKNIGWDATWCYLVRKYYLTGKCPWATQAELTNKRQSVEFLEQSLIGAMGQELYMADTNQSPDPKDWISSHRFPQKYVILWFWDPDCHHCQEQTATLKALYDSLSAAGNKIFEVYAIGYESDVAKWKKYVREHQLPFVNVGGSNVNIDYQVAYNVHGAPTMIILNEERRIIMNKVLATKDILPFLERYEQRRAH
ncbi:MAG: DUF5106 domain-containing protein [Bacteroidales bacterium]|nr:DUF5106 domain-containing protein [Bacteroidales bacterium]